MRIVWGVASFWFTDYSSMVFVCLPARWQGTFIRWCFSNIWVAWCEYDFMSSHKYDLNCVHIVQNVWTICCAHVLRFRVPWHQIPFECNAVYWNVLQSGNDFVAIDWLADPANFLVNTHRSVVLWVLKNRCILLKIVLFNLLKRYLLIEYSYEIVANVSGRLCTAKLDRIILFGIYAGKSAIPDVQWTQHRSSGSIAVDLCVEQWQKQNWLSGKNNYQVSSQTQVSSSSIVIS